MIYKFSFSDFFVFQGIPAKKAKPEIMDMIRDIQLSDKANDQSRTLSGGMKRKLKWIYIISYVKVIKESFEADSWISFNANFYTVLKSVDLL